MIQVYIIDDHPSIIYGLQHMLGNYEEIKITGTFNTGRDLLAQLKVHVPDVLLLDIHLPDISGNQLARIISQKYPNLGILAFTNMNTDFHIQDMMNNGCLGYLLKTSDKETILNGILEVHAKRIFFAKPLKAELNIEIIETKKRLATLPSLTNREKEILKFICSGKTNQEIAEELLLSIRTIENHRFNMQQKLKVKSMAELIKYALHAGFTD